MGPQGVHRGQATPEHRVVHRIVVHKRGQVYELHHRCQGERVLGRLAPDLVGEQEQGGTEQLSPNEQQVIVDLFDQRKVV